MIFDDEGPFGIVLVNSGSLSVRALLVHLKVMSEIEEN